MENQKVPTESERAPEHDPTLANTATGPKGVMPPRLKLQLYLGVAVLFIVATAVSSFHHPPANGKQAQKNQPPTPFVQDASDANVAEMKKTIEKQQQEAAHPQTSAGMNVPPTPYGLPGQPNMGEYAANGAPAGMNCVPGQPCPPGPQAGYGYNQQSQLTPLQQQQMQIEQQEKELAYKSRFASNLAYSQSRGISGSSSLVAPNSSTTNPAALGQQSDSYGMPLQATQPSSLVSPHAPGQSAPHASDTYKRPAEININSANGQPYVVYEGTLIDTVLMNRLDGDAAGPVKVLVTNPVYSHDQQHVLIPEGTVALGEARKIGSAGFGQQRRLAVVFHRMIMPDGYSVDLDQFQGLNQTGETGLKDKVNNHYLQIFGTSIALGIIAGAAEISSGNGGLYPTGEQAFQYGAASSVSESATTILDQFINIPPTITIREGHRVKVYISQDMLLPAYDNHTIPNTF